LGISKNPVFFLTGVLNSFQDLVVDIKDIKDLKALKDVKGQILKQVQG